MNGISKESLVACLEKLIPGRIPRERDWVEVRFPDLLANDMGMAGALLESPVQFLEMAEKALTEMRGRPLSLRVRELPETLRTGQIGAAHVGKFVQVGGIVLRVSAVRAEAKVAKFRCKWCGLVQEVAQQGQILRVPEVCENPNCTRRTGPFDFLDCETVYQDWQEVIIQERPEELKGGQSPTPLTAILRGSLTNSLTPGDHSLVTGVVRVFRPFGRKDRIFTPVLELNHVQVLDKGWEEAELEGEMERRVRELAGQPGIEEKIVDSVAPELWGNRHIKEAIALQMFGSPEIVRGRTRFRGNIHILLCGDPGTAKSKTLVWVASVAPRAIYASGKKSSAGGLTAVVVRDELTRSWSLEAGAMVLADQGLLCLDELDKMDEEDRTAMLEGMESHQITINKAGIHAVLNCRTSVLAAANPRFSRWDPNRNVYEQLNVDPVLLSRFDLIFVLRDVPERGRDEQIADHLLSLRCGKGVSPPLSEEELRALVVYGRKRIFPRVEDPEVMRAMKEFYLQWRSSSPDQGAPPTARQLEAVWRLSVASARMRFSERVEMCDVQRAVRLLNHFLSEAGIDVRTGRMDMDVILTGKPKSVRERQARIYQIIEQLERENEEGAPVREVVRRAVELGMEKEYVYEVIEEETKRGYLYSPAPDVVKRMVKL
ncbi:MAG: minichromosome maintenance protein MCM [Candidatus Hadarchaeales archaeon]